MSTKRYQRTVGNAASDGGTPRTHPGLEDGIQKNTGPESAGDPDKAFRTERAAGDHISQSEAAPGSPLLPPQPPNNGVLPSEMASRVSSGHPSPDPYTCWLARWPLFPSHI